jgi:hypothetical protein
MVSVTVQVARCQILELPCNYFKGLYMHKKLCRKTILGKKWLHDISACRKLFRVNRPDKFFENFAKNFATFIYFLNFCSGQKFRPILWNTAASCRPTDLRSSVVHRRQRVVALLPGRVPDLELDCRVVQTDRLRQERGADCRLLKRDILNFT